MADDGVRFAPVNLAILNTIRQPAYLSPCPSPTIRTPLSPPGLGGMPRPLLPKRLALPSLEAPCRSLGLGLAQFLGDSYGFHSALRMMARQDRSSCRREPAVHMKGVSCQLCPPAANSFKWPPSPPPLPPPPPRLPTFKNMSASRKTGAKPSASSTATPSTSSNKTTSSTRNQPTKNSPLNPSP